MPSRHETYSLPKGRLAKWLVEPGQDTPHDIRVALIGTLFGTLPIFFGGVLNTIAVAWVLAVRHPTLPFRLWLLIEVAVCMSRLWVLIVARRRATQGKETPTDLYILLAPLWGATVGYGAMVSAISGDWIATTLSFLSAAAMVGGICFRNFAAPRLTMVMITLSLGPCSIGALMAGEPVLLLVLLQSPFYLIAMSIAAQRLNSMLITTMKAEREHSHRARHDTLTGLLNREGLFQAMEQRASAAATPYTTLIYLDLDGFKPVNDNHGHATGDLLLKQVAVRLLALASPNALVARMGGDEFVIIEAIPDEATRQAMTDAIMQSIEQPFVLAPGVTATVGASVGMSNADHDVTDIDALLRVADTAMYNLKRRKTAATPTGAGRQHDAVGVAAPVLPVSAAH